MANKYIEPLKYPVYAAVPGWGLAQDGDGTVNGLAVSAIGSVLFNATHASGTVSIMGVSVTFTLGTSVDAQANALATAINASTTAVNSGTTPNGTQLRDMLYARGPANGAPSGTTQIMTRPGSAALNHANNANVLITHSLNGTAPTITQFAGGVSGSWGYFVNTAVLWPSAMAIGKYGVLWAKPLIGDAAAGDTIYVRTAKDGNPILLELSPAANPNSFRTFGNSAPVRFVFNSGGVWPETNGRLTVRYRSDYQYLNLTQAAENASDLRNNRHFIGGECSTDSDPNFGFEMHALQYQTTMSFRAAAACDLYENVFFSTGSRTVADAQNTYSAPLGMSDSNAVTYPEEYACVLRRCLFVVKQGNNGAVNSYGYSNNISFLFEDCKVRGLGVTSITAGLFTIMSQYSSTYSLRIRSLSTEGIPANTPIVWNVPTNSNTQVTVEDTDMTNLEASQGFMVDANINQSPNVNLSGVSAGFPFLLENSRRSVYWLPTKGIPTLNANTPDNFAMAWAVQISTNPLLVFAGHAVRLPRMALLNPTANGIKTVSVNMLIDKDRVLKSNQVYFDLRYTDTNGVSRSESTNTQDITTLAEVTNMTPDWSQVKNDGQGNILPYMTLGADRFYRRYRLSLTTKYPVKTNTSIMVQVQIAVSSTSNTDRFVICPEVIVS